MKNLREATTTASWPPSRWDSKPRLASQNGLSRLPNSAKLFVSLFLCLLGLAYLAFLGQIWVDTGMQISLIAEGYRDMGAFELVSHSFRYLAWFFTVFAGLGGLLLFTRYPEKLKTAAAVWLPFWIVSDIGSVWLIGFHDFFAFQLYVSGLALAVSFLVLFCLIQADLWFSKSR